MKTLKHLTLLSLFFIGIAAHAAQGNEAGGGGSRLESAFRLTASSLITRLKQYPAAQSLCPSSAMQQGLDKTKILVVDTLVDLNTGNPITNTSLDAWTRPGTMQLKKRVWLSYIDGNGNFKDLSVSALILHEVYRTTTACDDDNGGLSTATARLLLQLPAQPKEEQKNYNKLFTLKYAIQVPPSYHLTTSFPAPVKFQTALCDVLTGFGPYFKPGAVCLLIGTAGYWNEVSALVLIRFNSTEETLVQVFNKTDSEMVASRLTNLAGFITPAEPLYLMFNLQNGLLSYGLDLRQMTLIPNNTTKSL